MKTEQATQMEYTIQTILEPKFPGIKINVYNYQENLVSFDAIHNSFTTIFPHLYEIQDALMKHNSHLYGDYILVSCPVTQEMFEQRIQGNLT